MRLTPSGAPMTEPQRGSPPMVGWWPTRAVRSTGMTNDFNVRRWWNGTDWSLPVSDAMSDEQADHMRTQLAFLRPNGIEWIGLTVPARSYPYFLHAQDDAAAFMGAEGGAGREGWLDAQNALIEKAFYTKEKEHRARRQFGNDAPDPPFVGPDEAPVAVDYDNDCAP